MTHCLHPAMGGFITAIASVVLSGCTTPANEHAGHHHLLPAACHEAYRRGETNFIDAKGLMHLCPIDHLELEEGYHDD